MEKVDIQLEWTLPFHFQFIMSKQVISGIVSVGVFKFYNNTLFNGNQHLWGKRDFRRIVIHHIVMVCASHKQLAVKVNSFRACHYDDGDLAVGTIQFVRPLYAVLNRQILAGEPTFRHAASRLVGHFQILLRPGNHPGIQAQHVS